MTHFLTVKDRILLFGLLPTVGDIGTARILRKLREELSFSEDDHSKFELKRNGHTWNWNPATATVKEVEIGPQVHEVVCDVLKRLSEGRQITVDLVDIYDRFIGDT